MKIVISQGCTAFYTTIDGKPISEVNQGELLGYLLQKVKEEVVAGTISIDNVIELLQPDDEEYDENACEQCGDTVNKRIWNI